MKRSSLWISRETPIIQEIPRVLGALCQEPWTNHSLHRAMYANKSVNLEEMDKCLKNAYRKIQKKNNFMYFNKSVILIFLNEISRFR